MVFGIYLAVPVKINLYHSLVMGRGVEPIPAAGGGKGTPLQKLPAHHRALCEQLELGHLPQGYIEDTLRGPGTSLATSTPSNFCL